jgi:conjugal transfer pilus assembly protein TraK
MMTRRLSILAAVLAASSAQAAPAFELPLVPCSLLDGACTPSAVSSVLQTSRSEPSSEGVIRTVVDGEAIPARRTGGSLPVALELGPRNLTVTPGTTVLIEIAIGHLNRIAKPFANPVVHTVSGASTQVDGSVVYVAYSGESGHPRLFERRVRAESTLPPEMLLPGERHSQEVKCLAVGQADRSVPHSPTSLSAR